MKHTAVNVSGGFGSFATLLWVSQNTSSFSATFAETNIEHKDLYRFLYETVIKLAGSNLDLSKLIDSIPPLQDIEARKKHLKTLGRLIKEEVPWFTYLSSPYTPFDIFVNKKFAGGMKGDPCSLHLKREPLDKHNSELANYYDLSVAIGIGEEESHRFTRMPEKPFTWLAPLIDHPEAVPEAYQWLEERQIKLPELYSLGFPHNNCSGFCIKSGQKQASLLYSTSPEDYLWFEEQQLRVKEVLPEFRHKYVGHIKKQVNGERSYLTLREWRENYLDISPEDDNMGCGCFISDVD